MATGSATPGGATVPASGGAAAAIGNLLRIPLLPLLWLARVLIIRIGAREGMQIASFSSFPSLIYTWPICAMSWVAVIALQVAPDSATIGWLWLIVVLFTLIVIATDVGRNTALGWALFTALLFACGALLYANFKIPILGMLYDHFAGLNVRMDKGLAWAAAEWTTLMLAITIMVALLDGQHEISSREMTHRRFLRTSENWPLTMNRVRLEWPDMLEMCVLFGAGHLVIIDQDRREILRIMNVPFLWFFRDEVSRILDVMATTEVPAGALQQST